eukprot:7612518-Pyramimonas_sp.AAC.1
MAIALTHDTSASSDGPYKVVHGRGVMIVSHAGRSLRVRGVTIVSRCAWSRGGDCVKLCMVPGPMRASAASESDNAP